MRSANLGTDPSITNAGEEYAEIEPSGRDELLDTAMELANEIETKAFRQSNGDLGWMVLHYSPAAERYTLQPMENDLYNGRAGVGLFFAALEKLLPGSSYRALAQASLAPVQRWIKLATDQELTEFGFGGYAGLSSIAYAMTRAGEFLREGELIADARIAALRIRPDQIEKDESLDAMSGCAGAIPGLLACYAATGEPKILASAIACGRHLLQRRELDRFGFKTWPTLEKCHLTGFSHGAAGIAYALLQLYKVTSDAEFYDAALEGIFFEGRAFVREQNNWPDYRRAATKLSQGPMFCMAWCHGAPESDWGGSRHWILWTLATSSGTFKPHWCQPAAPTCCRATISAAATPGLWIRSAQRASGFGRASGRSRRCNSPPGPSRVATGAVVSASRSTTVFSIQVCFRERRASAINCCAWQTR